MVFLFLKTKSFQRSKFISRFYHIQSLNNLIAIALSSNHENTSFWWRFRKKQNKTKNGEHFQNQCSHPIETKRKVHCINNRKKKTIHQHRNKMQRHRVLIQPFHSPLFSITHFCCKASQCSACLRKKKKKFQKTETFCVACHTPYHIASTNGPTYQQRA